MSFLRTILTCCRSSDAEEDPERQQLLNPDIIPQAPTQEPSRTTQEQEDDRRKLDQILHQTQDRLVSITSPSPFLPSHSHSTADHSSSSRPSSPTPSTSTLSTWRPTPDQPVRIISLASALDPHHSPSSALLRTPSRNGHSGKHGKRPASAHSLKTLTRSGATALRQQNGRPSPLGRRPTSDGEYDDTERDGHDEEEGEEGDGYGTVASYRTAVEGRGTLRGLWDGYGEGEEELRELTAEEEEQLRKKDEALAAAIRKLEGSMDGFKIEPVGNLVESWPE